MQLNSNDETPLEKLISLSPKQVMEHYLKQVQEMSSEQLREKCLENIQEISTEYSLEQLFALPSEQLWQLHDELSRKKLDELSQELLWKEHPERLDRELSQHAPQQLARVAMVLLKLETANLDKVILSQLSKKFPEQWEEVKHIFDDLSISREWELKQNHAQLVVNFRYCSNFLYTWLAFLTAIALGSIKEAFYRLS